MGHRQTRCWMPPSFSLRALRPCWLGLFFFASGIFCKVEKWLYFMCVGCSLWCKCNSVTSMLTRVQSRSHFLNTIAGKYTFMACLLLIIAPKHDVSWLKPDFVPFIVDANLHVHSISDKCSNVAHSEWSTVEHAKLSWSRLRPDSSASPRPVREEGWAFAREKTSIKKRCQKGTPSPRGGFLFCCFWLFGQANGKITIKFRIAFGCLGSESHAPRRSSMNLMEIMAIGQWDHRKPWMINNQLWPRKDGWRRWGTYMDLWGIIPTAYGDLNVGDEALHH